MLFRSPKTFSLEEALGKPAPTPVDENNGWIPTWEQMKHEGFAGRIITGEGMPKKPGEEGQPTPTIGETIKGIGQQLKEHPVDMAKALTRGILEDPELLHPYFWEATPAKLAAILEKAGVAAKTAYGIARTGAAGAGLEAAAEAREGKIDPQAIANTGAQFAAFRAAHDVAAGTYKLVTGKGRQEAIKPEDVKTEAPETPTAKPIEGALDASHFSPEDLAPETPNVETVTPENIQPEEPKPEQAAPEVKLEKEIDRAAQGLNPEPTPEEVKAAPTEAKPTVPEEGKPIEAHDADKLILESKEALDQNLAEKQDRKSTRLNSSH